MSLQGELSAPELKAIPASQFSFETLVAIYNATRTDYLVPMPMNAVRMTDYVLNYDVKLEHSCVVVDDTAALLGLSMLGVRAARTWITRLGVTPEARGKGVGRFMMNAMLTASITLQAVRVQLEVIKGNAPAIALFHQYGFNDTRELLVMRRPPGSPAATIGLNTGVLNAGALNAGTLNTGYRSPQPLDKLQILSALSERRHDQHLRHHDDQHAGQNNKQQDKERNKHPNQFAWTEETASLLHLSNLYGLSITSDAGEHGWIIYQLDRFQIEHVTIMPGASVAIARALLIALHTAHPDRDTKTENLPLAHPHWGAFQDLGYIENFTRIEMTRELSIS